MASRLMLVGIATLFSYRLAEPYAFLGPDSLDWRPNPKFIADMLYWVQISSGEIEVPFMIQWAGTPNPRFALDSLLRWGLGPARRPRDAWRLALATLSASTGGSAQPAPAAGRLGHVINLAYFGGQFAKFLRYLLPVYPALAILAAYLLAAS